MKRLPWILVLLACMGSDDCGATAVSASGVGKATVKVPTGPDGLTAEQRNIRDRLVHDNKPGAVKHLYIISAYSGQVIFYSTVRGKVTSGGKRLTPTSVAWNGQYGNYFNVDIGVNSMSTTEVLQDDGAYGHSSDYLYWWDTQGRYYQYYITGGVIPLISDQPIAVRSVIINMEVAQAPGEAPPAPPPAQ